MPWEILGKSGSITSGQIILPDIALSQTPLALLPTEYINTTGLKLFLGTAVMRNCTLSDANCHFWGCETALFRNLGDANL